MTEAPKKKKKTTNDQPNQTIAFRGVIDANWQKFLSSNLIMDKKTEKPAQENSKNQFSGTFRRARKKKNKDHDHVQNNLKTLNLTSNADSIANNVDKEVNSESNNVNGGVKNKDNSKKNRLTKFLAMDCEMVGIGYSGNDHMLARVSIVNKFGDCIYDKFVKAREEVKDYRTDISGVRKEDLLNGEDFTVVQKEVSELLRGRILVGHSLKNDLAVLFLSHPKRNIRDTSRYKPFRKITKGSTPSLKRLAKEILGIDIQSGEHSSVEDARAAMQLYCSVARQWEPTLADKRGKKKAQGDFRAWIPGQGQLDTSSAEAATVQCGTLPKWAIERYSRQILLKDIGVHGQTRICQAKVLIVGAGGLGCPSAMYLAAAGVVSLVLGWGYRASDQRRWAVLHPACGGRQQSPIAIAARQAIPISIPAMELIGYQNPLPGPLTITNNGHSVALTIPKYSSEEEKKGFRLPFIFGGPLDNEYEIEGLHFHWGDKNNRGSEHTLNDMRLPLEMHIIHRNKKYRNLAEALQHPDGLCVLAFFYQVVEFDAKLLTPIVKNLSAIENYNTSMQLPHTFSLSSILSGLDTERFYTYKGSLTTPPCAEAVTWVVFSDYLPISVFQMDNFRGLLSNLNLPLVDNFRQLQPLFGRRIFVRITSKNPKFKKTKLHYSKWDWVGHKKAENDVAEFDE